MIGRTLGHYRVFEKLGEGGMGQVYRAHDEVLDRDVAIKVLPERALADEAARKHFRKEALALSKLNHPHIGTIHDFGTQDGVDFLVMEYIPGTTLALKIAAGPLPEKEVLALGAQIAEALEELHEQGMVHRDLKPGNIIVTPKGQSKVLDFGLASLRRPVTEVTTTDALSDTVGLAGTLPYMSPEQLQGEPADARMDIYALGAVLYELAAGHRPFRGDLVPSLTDAVLHQPVVSPRALNARVSADLERIILKCLEKEADRRYQSAKEVEVDLRRLASPSLSGISSPPSSIPRRRTKAKRIRSLAVLPLVNLASPSEEYFADGMTEALIADLAQIGELRVISRTSVMRYKGTNKPLPGIARDLGVDCLVEGSILRAGNQVRITAQLIHAASDTHLWAKSYERDLNNILVLQREVARAIVEEIRVNLTAKQRARLAASRLVQPEAYEAYLKGRYYWNKRTGQDIKRAIEYFQQALAIDPDYAPTYAGLADAYHVFWFYTGISPREKYPLAKAAALKALEIDNSLAEAHTSLAAIKADDEWDFPGAEAEFRKAILLNPNYPIAHQWFAQYLAYFGRFEEAIAEIRKAQQLDPLSPITHTVSGDTHLRARQYDQAIAQLKKAIEIEPNFSIAHSKLRDVYLEKKMVQEAISEGRIAEILGGESHERATESTAALSEAYAKFGEDGYWRKRVDSAMEKRDRPSVLGHDESPYCIASIYARLGEEELAIQWLQRAVEERDVSVMYVKTAPEFDRLRSDPRAIDLMLRIGLPK
jgi:eukaryotic-like serine/threonine-protein kinase